MWTERPKKIKTSKPAVRTKRAQAVNNPGINARTYGPADTASALPVSVSLTFFEFLLLYFTKMFRESFGCRYED